MAEYIDKQNVLNDMIQYLGIKSKDYLLQAERALYKRVEQAPAADVRSVVLCRDCEYCRKEDEFEYWCYGFCSPARLVRKDDFCSYGKAVLT